MQPRCSRDAAALARVHLDHLGDGAEGLDRGLGGGVDAPLGVSGVLEEAAEGADTDPSYAQCADRWVGPFARLELANVLMEMGDAEAASKALQACASARRDTPER